MASVQHLQCSAATTDTRKHEKAKSIVYKTDIESLSGDETGKPNDVCVYNLMADMIQNTISDKRNVNQGVSVYPAEKVFRPRLP